MAIIAILIALMALPAARLEAAAPGKTEAELRALREKIDRITQQVSRDALERDRLSGSLKAAELSVGQARTELSRASREYADRSARRGALGETRQQQQQALANQRAALAAQLRVAYMIGREEPLKLLLNQQDPLHSDRLFAYYGYFGRARAGQIAQIQTKVQRLDALDVELAQQQTELATLRTAQQQQLQQFERARNDRQQVLASLTAAARTREQSLARLKSQQADLEGLLQQLNRSLKSVAPPDNATAFGRSRGALSWPVAGQVTARFGDNRASGVKWEGIVIATERDAPVKAVSGGRVVYADWLPGLGLLAIIDHGEGYLSLYGHNDRLLKAVGESVAAGEPIAAAGDTGGRAAPELYFEIRRGGRPVDPAPWFKARSPSP
ncbi:MAG TPA: peptidoglycan DD-metalloendopeptidase family protein [Steroidobacteraceae bacterium]|jgi:septal ring factor EnvC (AmiA/AmiB activator)|nr:peptidoglycan DD-metalloendopeptidase family protein [Steroidobacteraceae bacterium]